MPVQFTCSRCRRTLSVSQRKAGTTVACPKCGEPNVVPQPTATAAGEPASAAAPVVEATAPPSPVAPAPLPPAIVGAPAGEAMTAGRAFLPEAGVFDDIPALISEPVVKPVTVAAPPPIVSAPPLFGGGTPGEPALGGVTALPITPRQASMRRGRQADGTVLLITRQAVYAQAGLVAGLVLLAFIAGLLIGRGSRPTAKVSTTSAPTEPVALEGHVLYALSPGASLPDGGATVMALPAGKKPDHRIDARGLRAGDDDDLDAAPSAEALRAIGGAVVRSDDGGQFQLVVPRPGDYSLLIISRHASRPDGLTVALADAEELSQYFASPKELIGQRRYALIARRLAGAPPPCTHEFGPTDKK